MFGDIASKLYILDTCSLARKAPKKLSRRLQVEKFVQFCTGNELSNNHRAMVNTLATVDEF
jgi:hypothetical protein